MTYTLSDEKLSPPTYATSIQHEHTVAINNSKVPNSEYPSSKPGLISYLNSSLLFWQIIVISCLFISFAGIQTVWTTLSVALPSMLSDKKLNMDNTMAGLLIGCGTGAYLLGKLGSGPFCSYLGGKKAMVYACVFITVTCLIFGYMSHVIGFVIVWSINKVFQSVGYPAMTVVTCVWVEKKRWGTVFGILNSSYGVSSLFAGFVLGAFLIQHIGWRGVFYLMAGIMGAISILLWFLLKDAPADVKLKAPNEENADHEESTNPLENANLLTAIKAMCCSPQFWLLALSISCQTVGMDVQNFLPMHLSQTKEGVSEGVSGVAASVNGAATALCILFAGPIYDRLSKLWRGVFLISCLMLCIASFAILWLWSTMGVALSLVMYGIAGAMLAPAYYLPMSVFSMEFGGVKHCATVVGVLDAFGYASSSTFSFVGGWLVQSFGWGVFFATMTGIMAVGTLFMLGFLIYPSPKKKQPLLDQKV